jgi:hypothetical protein
VDGKSVLSAEIGLFFRVLRLKMGVLNLLCEGDI